MEVATMVPHKSFKVRSDQAVNASDLKACEHQVGGHMTKDSQPDTLVDGKGSFYKPYQAGERNVREAAFYSLVWGKRLPAITTVATDPDPTSPVATPDGAQGPVLCSVVDASEEQRWGEGEAFLNKVGSAKPQDIEGIKAFIPRSHGVTDVDGRHYLVLEDVCASYTQPCVLDLKMGFTTQYAWASEAYKEKCKAKDAITTQSTIGFRLSGLQVYSRAQDEMFKSPRQWGKTLTAETMPDALRQFAGGCDPSRLYVSHPKGVMPQLLAIREWFATQRSFCFYQASLLFTYEGQAEDVEDANVQVHLIDFAHTFPTNGEPDSNFLAGLDSLIAMLNGLAAN